eukprot:SAG25_NODE_3006_length_1270_cov_47.069172_1_plen_35_part_10
MQPKRQGIPHLVVSEARLTRIAAAAAARAAAAAAR